MDYYDFLKRFPNLVANNDALLKVVEDPAITRAWRKKRLEELNLDGLPLSWADIGIVFTDPYFFIVRDLVQFPDGGLNGYCRVLSDAYLTGGNGIVVLPKYKEKIMLLRQYRHPTRQWHYEVPRGYGEKDLPAIENAKKEIEEETGSKVTDIVDLGEFHSNTGFEGNAVTLFFAELASFGAPNQNEGIESFVWLFPSELEEWIATGRITDGFTIGTYTRAKLKGLI